MSVTSVGSNQSQSIGSQLLQQLMANSSTSQSTTTGSLEDLLSLSPAAQQLAQAPSAVVNAMGDLLSGQKDVQGDLSQLKSFFQQNPQNLASLLSSLQGWNLWCFQCQWHHKHAADGADEPAEQCL